MTVFASWHHSTGAPDPRSLGLEPLLLVSGVRDSLTLTLGIIAEGEPGVVYNAEEGKEAAAGELTADRFLIAHAILTGGVDAVYGLSNPDLAHDRRTGDDPHFRNERLRAQAIGPLLRFLDTGAYCPFSLAQISADANGCWRRYAQSVIRHAERASLIWRSVDGSPLPVRRWVSDRNLAGETLDRWWHEETRKLLAVLGGHIVLLQGNGPGDTKTPWTTKDLAFVNVFSRTPT